MEPAVRCHLIRASGSPPVIVWVVDDSADDDLTSAFARESAVPSPNFWGVSGAGKNGDADAIAFRLVDRDSHRERTWWMDTFGPPLLGAILEVPHIVVVHPREIADALKLTDTSSADVVGLLALPARRPVRPRHRAVHHVRDQYGHVVSGDVRGLHHLRVTGGRSPGGRCMAKRAASARSAATIAAATGGASAAVTVTPLGSRSCWGRRRR